MLVASKPKRFTPEQMAAKLRVSLRTLQRMMKAGTAPEHYRLGKKVVFVERLNS